MNVPPALVPALVWVAPTKPSVTMLSPAKPVPLTSTSVPAGPDVGLTPSAAVAAKAEVAGIEKIIKHAAREAKIAARPENDRLPVTLRPRANKVLTGVRDTRT